MSEPNVPAKAPFEVDVEAGQSYWWCSCGKSENQPFCDGSHKGTSFSPVEYTAEETGPVWFCGCKHTGDQPMCDGAHKNL